VTIALALLILVGLLGAFTAPAGKFFDDSKNFAFLVQFWP